MSRIPPPLRPGGPRSGAPGPRTPCRPRRAGRRLTPLLALLLAAGCAASARAAAGSDEAQRAIHLLDYVAVDYSAAVDAGAVIDELEYREQLEFVQQVGAYLERLAVAGDDPLRGRLGELEAALRGRREAAEITARAREISADIRSRFGVRALPSAPPSLERGRALFTEACASCHGPGGRGDGPSAAGLKPPPADMTDRERMLALSPSALFSSIGFGVDGTAMAGFAERFDADQRFDLAFYVGSLAFSSAEVERGRALLDHGPGALRRRLPDLATLVQNPARELAREGDGLALVAYLRTHPEALQRGVLPLDLAQGRLAESWQAYARGERSRSVELAVAAYLEGFEYVEPALAAVDGALRTEVEQGFLSYRALLREGRPTAEIEPLYRSLQDQLGRAEQRLEGAALDRAAIFVSSLVILAREGLEAVLVVVALYGILLRSGRREGLRYLHAGWLAALGAGAITWVAARELVRISGAQREVIEGVSSLLAAVILLYVSHWLLSRVGTGRWQAFLDRRVRSALSRGSRWALAGVAFVAVYREIFETILFYQALWSQAGPQGARPILTGMAAGAGLLVALALVVFRFGRRLPLRRFFAASSGLLYALAVVMTGHGIAALQEADWLGATLVSFVRIEWLGIYPSAEGLAVQGLLVLAACAATLQTLLARRPGTEPPAARVRP